ncbi:Zn(II)2Cys6 transcription factor domain-containing protein [Aspergillus undulatus]|uniref:Zn(II)2Cys6 transcription factor domain-containing protein n=1 Tax=Aspergillus undulatus TaxID=1810928 RepID=UPI003CCCCAA9
MTPADRKRAKHPRPPRKKACTSCTRSKVRCNLERPRCSRCRSLGRTCEYTTPSSASIPALGSSQDASDSPAWPILSGPPIDPAISGSASVLPNLPNTAGLTPSQSGELQITNEQNNDNELDLTSTHLAVNDSADDIRDRWLRPYFMPSLYGSENSKVYQPFTLQFLSRVLSTYPHRMIKDKDVPPIVHRSQVSGGRIAPALANCYTLVRMWVQAVPGSERIVVDTVRLEMERLAVEPSTLCDIDHLSAFQAYLTYLLLMYSNPLSIPSYEQSLVSGRDMITLMEMAYRTARHGLICTSELSRTRPTWESWIVASTKRRAIYVMYLFSSLYNAENDLPNFLGEELRDVFAPEAKALWEARSRAEWERAYDLHLREWPDGILQISELWRSEETGSARRRERVERWLKTVDEFGMMLFSVCAHIHGC